MQISILWGGGDEVVKHREILPGLKENIPDCKVTVLEGEGHSLP